MHHLVGDAVQFVAEDQGHPVIGTALQFWKFECLGRLFNGEHPIASGLEFLHSLQCAGRGAPRNGSGGPQGGLLDLAMRGVRGESTKDDAFRTECVRRSEDRSHIVPAPDIV